MALEGEGMGKGSGRSGSSVDIGRWVAMAGDLKGSEAGGGDAMAAGISLHESQVPACEAFVASE